MRFAPDGARIADLEATLSSYPTAGLMEGDTPLHHLSHVGSELDLDLWLKRDDLIPLGLGGDKPRKLDFELARALADHADVIVTCGSAQSNHARLTSAAARRLGLDVVLVLSNDEHAQVQGNLLTIHLMGGTIVMADTEDHWDLDRDVTKVMEQLRAEGRRPHFVPISGTTPHSCLGYVAGGLELAHQLVANDVQPDAIYVPFGTGGIFAGYLTALRAAGITTRLVGISVNRDETECRENLDRWMAALSDLLGVDPDLDHGAHDIDAGYVGAQYGDATEACLDAILLMGRTEGILLDPVYSGKVFAGLVGHAASARITPGETIVMLHSGGVPANFAYSEEWVAHLRRASG